MKRNNPSENLNFNLHRKGENNPRNKSTYKVNVVKNNKINEDLNLAKNATQNFFITDDQTKNFINFDIKIEGDLNCKNVKLSNLNVKALDKDISYNIKQIQILALDVRNKVESMKLEFDKVLEGAGSKRDTSDYTLDMNLLKSELINVKMKNEFLTLQAKFYENIFYTCKNCVENYQLNDTNIKTVKVDLKDKLNSIFSQNNKHYYENFNTKENDESSMIEKESKYLKSVRVIENELTRLMNSFNKFISTTNHYQEDQLFNLKSQIISSQKAILSYYILNEDFNKDFKHKFQFLIENEDKLINLESKQRSNKIVKDFNDYLSMHINKIISVKLKNEIAEKINNITSFYESFNVILKTENLNLKNNTNSYVMNSLHKVGNISKLIDSYLRYTDDSFARLREIIELLNSKQIKNLEKVLFSFVKNEENVFQDLIDKYEELNKNYDLIK